MSHNLWVIAAGVISIISGASITGGYSTVVGDQNFGGPSLNRTENMGTDRMEGRFIPISAITRPEFSHETLLSHSRTELMQEWAGSAYRTPEPPVSSRTNTRYSRVVTATPPVEVSEEHIDSGYSSSQQPVTKKQRTGQQGQQTRHTPVETSADDTHIVDDSLFTGGKSIPSWMQRAVATEEAKRDAGTRKEPTMTPTKRDRKTQHSREAVPQRVMKASTTAAEELTLAG
ncbi:hypothetical protein B9Z19DRAFT_1123656 [Tuber borchii]|uniref:Uncharacterized protein n=1 Tax=Tuber borchii TaxID=42251 RepID=A0A2T6ZY70_TUBBO|nr:hypothetical protein B9Z19DRAFT_1123656 [Tuber borchii]